MPLLPSEPIDVLPTLRAMKFAIIHPAIPRRMRLKTALIEGLAAILMLSGVALGLVDIFLGIASYVGVGAVFFVIGASIESENRHRVKYRIAKVANADEEFRNEMLLRGVATRLIVDQKAVAEIAKRSRPLKWKTGTAPVKGDD